MFDAPGLWIPASDSSARLHLIGLQPDWPGYYWAELEDVGLSCRARVMSHDPGGRRFGDVFRDMNDSWRGWQGEKHWESPEGELELRFSMSATGNIGVKVALRDPYRWTARTTMGTQSGDSLSQLLKEAERFEARLESAA